MKKQLICGLAATALALSSGGTMLGSAAEAPVSAPTSAESSDSLSVGDYSYVILADNTAAITGYTGSDEVLEIPGDIDGRSVTAIGEYAFIRCTNLKSITLPDSVTSIGKFAFCSCTSLERITIPDSMKSIPDCVFKGCTALKTVELPETLTNIGGMSFYGCTSLEEITIPESAKSIDAEAFYNCPSLKSVTIPAGVKEIGHHALGYYWDNNKYNKYEGFKILCFKNTGGEKYAIDNGFDHKLIEEEIVDSGKCGETLTWALDSTGTLTVSGTGKMKDYLLDWETDFENAPWFEHRNDIKTAVIEDGVTSIGKSAFYGLENLETVTIPESVTDIESGAFALCASLESITIPDSVTKMGSALSGNVFYGCTSLKSIDIPGSIEWIQPSTFYGCTGLTSVNIREGVKYINASAFANCTGLTSVTIPNSIKYIYTYAFSQCPNLKYVTIPATVKEIGVRAFGLAAYDEDNDAYIKTEGFKIGCYKGTAGEKYAIDNEFDHELLDAPVVTNPAVTAAPGDNSVILNWGAAENADKYAVAVKVDGNWTIVAKTAETSYTLKGLKAGTEYEVAVIARFDGAWNTDFSNAITVAPKAEVSKYPKVTAADYNEQYHQFRIKWSAVNGATEYAAAVKVANKWKVYTTTEKTSFTSPKLKPGSVVEMVICAKVNGKWDTNALNSRAFKITVK